ncbi:4-alpha-glucanotransferase [bacterium]|nr:4-alpha-glucanotransferase [bacterium]
MNNALNERKAGILMHPSSLPGPFGIGTLGQHARDFIDTMAESGQSVWQILPLNSVGENGSPYNSYSSFSGDPRLIDPSDLLKEGLLASVETFFSQKKGSIDHKTVQKNGKQIATEVLSHLDEIVTLREEFLLFQHKERSWLYPHALFTALAAHFGTFQWEKWPAKFSQHDSRTMAQFEKEHDDAIQQAMVLQWLFFHQWNRLKEYANQKNIHLFGDMPIYVSHSSADVWWHQHLYLLDKNGTPIEVAGVPPDYFAKTGQLWGNPLYNWEAHKKEHFSWWITRFKHLFTLYDILRVDHFRGFHACWGIPVESKTAETGHWISSPGEELFSTLLDALGSVPIVAEDLGNITPEVLALRDKFNFPGMSVLQFAFSGESENAFLPHNYTNHTVCYSGTHDNDTTRGWYETIPDHERNFFNYYTEMHWGEDASWKMIRLAMMSVARLAIIPMQDILNLGSEFRLNLPGTVSQQNWSWRMYDGEWHKEQIDKLGALTKTTNRIDKR